MIDKTLDNLVFEVQTAIHQAAGLSTQVYSEGFIKNKITDAFIMLASDPDYNWKRYNGYTTRTLNGTTGVPTVSLTSVFNSFDDIEAIYPSGSDRPLVSGDIPGNPLLITGDIPRSYIYNTTSLIQIMPITSTGDIVVVGKSIGATSFIGTDTVPFDYLALKYFVAWQYMTEDGSNSAAAEVHRQSFENRMKQLKKSQMRAPLAINGLSANNFPNQWFFN